MRFLGFSLGNGVVEAFGFVPSGEPLSPDGAAVADCAVGNFVWIYIPHIQILFFYII